MSLFEWNKLYLSLTENKLLGEKVIMTSCSNSLWKMSFPKSSPSDKPVLASEWLSDLLFHRYFLLVKYFHQLLASSKYEGLKNHYGEIWDKGNQKLGTQIRMDGGLWWSFLVSHFKNIGIVSAIATVLYLCKSQKLKYVRYRLSLLKSEWISNFSMWSAIWRVSYYHKSQKWL